MNSIKVKTTVHVTPSQPDAQAVSESITFSPVTITAKESLGKIKDGQEVTIQLATGRK